MPNQIDQVVTASRPPKAAKPPKVAKPLPEKVSSAVKGGAAAAGAAAATNAASAQAASVPAVVASTAPLFPPGTIQLAEAWAGSFLVHVTLIVGMSFFIVPQISPTRPPALTVDVTPPEEEELEDFVPIELDERIEPAREQTTPVTSLGTNMDGSSGTMADMVSPPDMSETEAERESQSDAISSPTIFSMPREMFNIDVPQGTLGDARAVVDDYQEAMSRLTQELLLMLEKSDVLAVWCFDQSESMKDDQVEIVSRIDRVYAELGLIDPTSARRLSSGVVSYGSTFIVHTERPTSNLDTIREAIATVPVDPTGTEKVCPAVIRAISEHYEYAKRTHRQIALIVVSDESGDRSTNEQYLEQAILMAKSAECRVYVLGREAVFGYPYAHMRWIHPQTGHHHWLPVDRGPETAFVEQLQIDGFRRRSDAFGSGFGPYELSRMARETGGIFFMLPSVESNIVKGEHRRYELESMASYRPDLAARSAVANIRQNSPLRSVLFQVVNDLNPYIPETSEIIELRTHYSPSYPTFCEQVLVSNQKALLYLPYLEGVQRVLEEAEPLRDQELMPRWRANYDLMRAQVLTFRIRVYEYNAYLAEFVRDPKIVPMVRPNGARLVHWGVRARKETLTGDVTSAFIMEAESLLQKVIEEHPGTPWAARAQSELDRGFGVELVEHYHLPRQGGGGGGVPQPELIPVPRF